MPEAHIEWRVTKIGLTPVVVHESGVVQEVSWAPQAGSQEAFVSCPVFEAIFEGERGPGKTEALLMDFAQDVGKGFGKSWRGVLFRRTYPELGDVIEKSEKLFRRIFPTAKYNRAFHVWEWPDGETLLFRHFKKESDYWSYHGHEYPWQGWEELTTWPDDRGYRKMFSCARSSHKGVPTRIRSTTNPYGIGHNWVKLRFRLPIKRGHIAGKITRNSRDRDGNIEPPRVAIHGCLKENKVLLHADPNYIGRLRMAARNAEELKAWIHGDWNIVAGGMLDDVWNDSVHMLPSFPFKLIPRGWKLDRAYDHGSSAPFSVGWYVESNGEPIEYEGKKIGSMRGDLIRIAEWYGWNGEPNTGVRMLAVDIAKGILEREDDWGLAGCVRPGPADSSVFDDYEPGSSVAGDMQKKGVRWTKADKGPGSRKQGWEQVRKWLKAAIPKPGVGREDPGLFITDRCEQFKRTVPVLPRSDKDPDDVDTDAEDHIGDELRYRMRRKNTEVSSGRYK